MNDVVQTFLKEYATYGYPVLFLGVFLENAGLPVPGETAVLIAGYLASPIGGAHFSLIWVIPVTIIAAVLGDNMGYWLGREVARPRLQRDRGFLFLTPARFARVEGYFHQHGVWTVFIARFITGLRVIAGPAAGASGMRWLHFFLANSAGAIVWGVTMSLLGYFFGHSWELLHRWLGHGAWGLLGLFLLIILGRHLISSFRKRPSHS